MYRSSKTTSRPRWPNLALLYVVLSLGCAIQSFPQNDEIELDRQIDQFMANQEKAHSATENRDARETIWVDMNGDGKDDGLVLYTLEAFNGSNLYLDYAAIFVRQNGRLAFKSNIIIGGKNRRAILKVESRALGKVVINTLEYTSKDASCCPSRKGKITISYKNNRLFVAPKS